MATWYSDAPPPPTGPITAAGWVRVVIRGTSIVTVILVGLAALLLLRLAEMLTGLSQRPWSSQPPHIVCRLALRIMGLRYRRNGAPMSHPGALVANHSSWLDIFALNATSRVFFVSKSDVAGWPGIGWLARATGTVFIRRDPRDAARQRAQFTERLTDGHRLLFFPEGTSSDGTLVLPFKSTLFAAFFDPALRDTMWIQPVTIRYTAPTGRDPRFYAWWGDMEFGSHFMAMLAKSPHGEVKICYHPPQRVSSFENRKKLALASEQAVRR